MSSKKTGKKNQTTLWTYPAHVKTFEAALYYGFAPIPEPIPEKADRDATKSLAHDWPIRTSHFEEKSSLLRRFFSNGIPAILPLSFIHEQPSDEEGLTEKRAAYGIDILGTNRSIADATIIKTAYEAVREEGYENISLEVNSVGDRDSLNRFSREFINYVRKNLEAFDPECRHLFKKSPLAVLNCTHEKCKEVRLKMPYPMNFLSEPSRTHFMEVLEFLETSALPYSVQNGLIECPDIALHTIFRIYCAEKDGSKKKVAAWGFRWGGLAKRLGLKKDVPSVSATIYSKNKAEKTKTASFKAPATYFIQIGEEARLKSLNFIESLRQVSIPVYHSLTKDKLSVQMATAEQLRVPFLLIMGQKESVEGTVLVRRMSDRSQETIRLDLAPNYLKKMLVNFMR